MCGIVGFIGNGDRTVLDKMVARIAHRGPDAATTAVFQEERVFLGHRRLAIIDLSDGNQPMWSADRRLCVVYNGEIYNHIELRKELEAAGARFETDHSDTEVLIHGYRRWGRGLCERLNGMFAFAIFDRDAGTLFLARDRFGEKPLFWARTGAGFLFASELPALLDHPDLANASLSPEAIRKFLAYSVFPAALTPYRDIEKLRPGHSLTYDMASGEVTHACYWRFEIDPAPPAPTPARIADWCEELRDLLKSSVEIRMMSDVPLGIFLSGGIDSTAVLAMMRETAPTGNIHAYSIGFDEPSFDESDFAKAAAKKYGVDLNLNVLTMSDALADADRLVTRIGEPIADSSILPTAALCRFARKEITVALGGDGGDELFCGYDPYKALHLAAIYDRLVPKGLHGFIKWMVDRLPMSHRNLSLDFKLKRTLRGLDGRQAHWLPAWMGALDAKDLDDLFAMPMPAEELYAEAEAIWNRDENKPLVDRASEFFVNFYLAEGVLTKVDRASMQSSLEVRAPFLDPRLAAFSARIPASVKFRRGEGKWLLKKALRGVVPDEILDRRKKGFGVPLSRWVNDMDVSGFPPRPLHVDKGWLGEARGRHLHGKADYRHMLWSIFAIDRSVAPLPDQSLSR